MAAELPIPGLSSVEVIGRGSSGVVYRANHDAGGRLVAVKVLDQVVLDAAGAARFREDFVILADATDHPAVVTVLAVGILPTGHPYLILDYVEGGSVASVTSTGVLDLAVAAAVMAEACLAVDSFHAAGLVHGDVTPGNILLSSTGETRLSGFGIAQHFGQGPNAAMLGVSPVHSAPEVVAGGVRTPPSDVWSLGSTLLEAVSRSSPFGPPGTSGAELVSTALGSADPVFEHAPRQLHAVLGSALVRDPALRCSAAHMASLLGGVGSDAVLGASIVANDPSIAISTTLSGDYQPIPKSPGIFADSPAPPGRRRVIGVMAALVIIFGLFVVAVATRPVVPNSDQVATGPGSDDGAATASSGQTTTSRPEPAGSGPVSTGQAPPPVTTSPAPVVTSPTTQAPTTAKATTTADSVDVASDSTTSVADSTSTTADPNATTTITDPTATTADPQPTTTSAPEGSTTSTSATSTTATTAVTDTTTSTSAATTTSETTITTTTTAATTTSSSATTDASTTTSEATTTTDTAVTTTADE